MVARSPTWCCRAPAPAAAVPGLRAVPPLRRAARPPAPGHPAPLPGGLPADGGRRRLRRAGAAGRAGVQGARPGGAGLARWARRWPWPWPRSSPPSPGRLRARCCSCRCPSSAAALRARGRDHVRELTVRAVGELRAAGLPAVAGPAAAPARPGARLRRALRRAAAGQPRRHVRARPGAPAPDGALLVLVDDVVTSGATLTEAGSVLAALAPPGRSAGARRRRRGHPAEPRGRDPRVPRQPLRRRR